MSDAKVVKMPLDNPQLDMVSIDVTYADGSYDEVLTAAAEAACPLVLHVVGKAEALCMCTNERTLRWSRKSSGGRVALRLCTMQGSTAIGLVISKSGRRHLEHGSLRPSPLAWA